MIQEIDLSDMGYKPYREAMSMANGHIHMQSSQAPIELIIDLIFNQHVKTLSRKARNKKQHALNGNMENFKRTNRVDFLDKETERMSDAGFFAGYQKISDKERGSLLFINRRALEKLWLHKKYDFAILPQTFKMDLTPRARSFYSCLHKYDESEVVVDFSFLVSADKLCLSINYPEIIPHLRYYENKNDPLGKPFIRKKDAPMTIEDAYEKNKEDYLVLSNQFSDLSNELHEKEKECIIKESMISELEMKFKIKSRNDEDRILNLNKELSKKEKEKVLLLEKVDFLDLQIKEDKKLILETEKSKQTALELLESKKLKAKKLKEELLNQKETHRKTLKDMEENIAVQKAAQEKLKLMILEVFPDLKIKEKERIVKEGISVPVKDNQPLDETIVPAISEERKLKMENFVLRDEIRKIKREAAVKSKTIKVNVVSSAEVINEFKDCKKLETEWFTFDSKDSTINSLRMPYKFIGFLDIDALSFEQKRKLVHLSMITYLTRKEFIVFYNKLFRVPESLKTDERVSLIYGDNIERFWQEDTIRISKKI